MRTLATNLMHDKKKEVNNGMICVTKDKNENASCWAHLKAFVRLTLKTCKHKKEFGGEKYMNINVKIK
jgi:SH3-like domain-containing protein